ncbi:unnamed protein product [Macrosiphum euphorbiae]|uniref:Uncharacterized protein n=1 Tax=Macrosiphum euphorbiae TaxID=13131 RepID=A0AAV0W1F9_9HEMI|nr:unnamed protein product [Macrosiphum euphorbiae]
MKQSNSCGFPHIRASPEMKKWIYWPTRQSPLPHPQPLLLLNTKKKKKCINMHTNNMWQTSWDEIPITNKLKSIKKKITKWYIQPNASRSLDILKLSIPEQESVIPTSPTYILS